MVEHVGAAAKATAKATATARSLPRGAGRGARAAMPNGLWAALPSRGHPIRAQESWLASKDEVATERLLGAWRCCGGEASLELQNFLALGTWHTLHFALFAAMRREARAESPTNCGLWALDVQITTAIIQCAAYAYARRERRAKPR